VDVDFRSASDAAAAAICQLMENGGEREEGLLEGKDGREEEEVTGCFH
jgi:hypothetical protein